MGRGRTSWAAVSTPPVDAEHGGSAPTTIDTQPTRVDAPQKHTSIQAEAENSTVSGGAYNLANDLYTSISGGCLNFASTRANPGYNSACVSTVSKGYFASITGGIENKASGIDASISGGAVNWAGQTHDAVLGGAGLVLTGLDYRSPE